MPIVKTICPKCGHAYNLPSDEAKRGFIRCPKCGYKAEDEKVQSDCIKKEIFI